MRCETTRAALLDFLNGELGVLPAWAVRRHLATCAACRAELAALRRFTETLRRADLALPEPAPAPRLHRTPRRRVLATAAALLVAGVLLLLPALYQHQAAQNPGAAIAAALGRVNTWHFSGWKLIDGKEVPWEVWGRRTPFLYYERVGEAVSWSDGKQFVRVFPPNAALNRPHGLVIKTAPDQTPGGGGFLDDPAYQTLVNPHPARTSFGDGYTTLYAQTPTEARFRDQYSEGQISQGVNANKLYTISKRDWLPTAYQLHYDSKTFARDTEFLTVRYGSALPDAVLAPPAADSYSVVDLSSAVNRPDGFRVTASPVAIDKAGNLVIAARGWLGGNLLTPGSLFSLDVQPYNGTFTAARHGQLIKYLYATNSSLVPGAEILMPFSLLEPSEVSSGLPDTFSLSMQATPQLLVRGSDAIVSDGTLCPSTHAENLLAKRFTWRLSVPKPVSTVPVKFPSAIDLAEVRRSYYYLGYDYRYTALKQIAPWLIQAGALNPNGTIGTVSPDGSVSVNMKLDSAAEAVEKRHPAVFLAAERKFRARAAYWQAQKMALMPQGGTTHEERDTRHVRYAFELQNLARCYQRAGDTAKSNHTLRRLLIYIQGDAFVTVLRRQAIYSMHTGSFPGDLGYKGP